MISKLSIDKVIGYKPLSLFLNNIAKKGAPISAVTTPNGISIELKPLHIKSMINI